MSEQLKANINFYIGISVILLQGVGSVYYYGQQQQRTQDELIRVSQQLTKLDKQYELVASLSLDVALLKASQLTLSEKLIELRTEELPPKALENLGNVFAVDLMITAIQRPTLLRDLSDVLAREKINVTAVNTVARTHRVQLHFTVEIRDAANLHVIIHRLSEVNGVSAVIRG